MSYRLKKSSHLGFFFLAIAKKTPHQYLLCIEMMKNTIPLLNGIFCAAESVHIYLQFVTLLGNNLWPEICQTNPKKVP